MQIKKTQEEYTFLSESEMKLLEELVNISSQTTNTKGVNQVQDLLEKELECLGLTTTRTSNPLKNSGDLLVAELKGSTSFVNLICHADTVLPKNKEHFFQLSKDKLQAFGPGVADNKGGVVVLLSAIQKYKEKKKDHKLSLRVIISPNEELGSTGFHDHFKAFGKDSKLSFGFEPSLENGDIIHSRNGNLWFELLIKGESCHSGRAPKGHMNAAFDLARILSFIDEKAYEREDITINVGSLEGGHSFNTISSEVKAKIDARFSNFEGLKFVKNLIEGDFNSSQRKCVLNEKKGNIELAVADFCPPLAKNESLNGLTEAYIEIHNSYIDKDIKSIHCGGAADINHFSHCDLFALDGLGPIGGNMHRLDEWIEVESLKSKSNVFSEFLIYLETLGEFQ